ncbi:sensor domain-containing diguanylate cyclase [Paucidesulfovibrio longus]|uniref:sensor domain-containing diguanylate cyclase n=1 Tax=Paucidesulfovibrio longus TaxID=889 RepID=UPI0003B3B01B|nr:diguanylate cyclase [Paucidesulfovibrio longus]
MPSATHQRISSAELLNAVASGAEELLSEQGWPDGVNTLLAGLGKVTGVSRVWIFQKIELRDNYIVQDYVFEWASHPRHVQLGMAMFSMFRTERNNPEYDELIQSRLRGEHQVVMTNALPRCWLRANQRKQNILSMLTLPIMVDGEWWGILGFDDCEREYEWSETEVALLRTAASLISGAIVRSRLSARVKQFNILRKLTDSAAWAIDLRRGRMWCSGELAGRKGVGPEGCYFTMRGALREVHPADRAGLLESIRGAMRDGKGPLRCDLRVRMSDGNYRWVELIGEVVLDSDSRPLQLSGIAVDIRHRKRTERHLRRQAVTDPLTGTNNRRTFMEELDYCFARAAEEGRPLSMLVMDLDHFKRINDTWGHPAGDAALRMFAEYCRQSLREGDLLARIGGEEFAVLLPDTEAESAVAAGERIRRSVCKGPVDAGGVCVPLTVSLGCATFPDDFPEGHAATPSERKGEELFALADGALYEAKRSGRNRLMRAANFKDQAWTERSA